MFDLRNELPVNPPELSAAQERAMEKRQIKKKEWVEDTVADRVKDTDWIIHAIISEVCDNPETQQSLVDLILGNGDINTHISNIKTDCMDWIQRRTIEDADRRTIW